MINRKDINILKAVAVLAVIIYHLNPGWLEYGYLGVDIFFVISGFLIIRIYTNKSDNFPSVREFISRRLKRIFPAMLLLLGLVYLYAFLKLPPVNLKITGQYVVSALIFASNILDATKGVDYFQIGSSANQLYHLWSLGLEFQFYIFISLYFAIINRLTYLNFKLSFLVIFGLSLTLAFMIQDASESSKFYMLPFRMWEFSIGGTIAFGVFKDFRGGIFLKILGLIFVAISLYFESKYINDIRNVICAIGCVLFIAYGINSFESNKYNIFNWIGILSYSLYLWHVPIQFVLLREMNVGVLYYLTYFIGLFTVSLLSYYFVEQKFRYNNYSISINTFLIAISFLLILIGLAGSINGGYPQRSVLFNNLKQNIGFGLRCNGNAYINKQCASSDSPSIAVVGNSYAMSFINPLLERGANLVQLTQDSCAIGYVDNVKSAIRMSCNHFFSEVAQRIRENSFEFIIISSPFDKELSNDVYLTSFSKFISDLGSNKIFIIGPTPRAPFNVGDCLSMHSAELAGLCNFHLPSEYNNKVNKLRGLFVMHDNIEFIDISDIICPDGYCHMTDGVDRPIYVDDGHLSLIGANIVTEKIINKFSLERL